VTDADGLRFPFEVNAFRKHSLLEGLDEIGITLKHTDAIDAYERLHHPAAAQQSGSVDFKDFVHSKN
jgi:3-isopropylmalate/(R)-2-methylmalate dehydratase small subunit